jgi:hypothetical protein
VSRAKHTAQQTQNNMLQSSDDCATHSWFFKSAREESTVNSFPLAEGCSLQHWQPSKTGVQPQWLSMRPCLLRTRHGRAHMHPQLFSCSTDIRNV